MTRSERNSITYEAGRRIAVLVLSVTVGLFGSVVLSVLSAVDCYAEDGGSCGSGVIWSLNDSGTLSISGRGEISDYEYDETAPWFSHHTDIKKVSIASGVTYVGERAFFGCTSLTEVTLANGVKEIGNSAFMACGKLPYISLPASIETIGDFAFSDCKKLETVVLRKGIEDIGQSIFEGCEALRCVHFTGKPADWIVIHPSTSVDPDVLEYNHDGRWDGGKISTQPTCSSEGVCTYTCTVCKDTKTEEVARDANNHVWNSGQIIKAPSPTSTGLKRFICTECGKIRQEIIPKTKMKLLIVTVKPEKNSAKLSWNKVAGAGRYLVYSDKCHGGTLKKKIKTVKASKNKLAIRIKDARKGKYKVVVVAQKKFGSKYKTIARSEVAHFVSSANRTWTNAASVRVNKKNLEIRAGKSKLIKAKAIKKDRNKKFLKHTKSIRFRSGNKKIATVDGKGRIKGVNPGKCTIYAIAENGTYKTVRVVIK